MKDIEISYEEYLEAMNIVLKYQKQILIWDKKVKKIGGSYKQILLSTNFVDLPYENMISNRATQDLLNNRIVKVEDLLFYTLEDFENNFKIGKKSREEILKFMSNNNLKFKVSD